MTCQRGDLLSRFSISMPGILTFYSIHTVCTNCQPTSIITTYLDRSYYRLAFKVISRSLLSTNLIYWVYLNLSSLISGSSFQWFAQIPTMIIISDHELLFILLGPRICSYLLSLGPQYTPMPANAFAVPFPDAAPSVKTIMFSS